jgi:hypothetical protein
MYTSPKINDIHKKNPILLHFKWKLDPRDKLEKPNPTDLSGLKSK